MLIRLKCLIFAIFCILQIQMSGNRGIAAQPPSDSLNDIRQILQPAIKHNSQSWFHHRPIRLLEVIHQSKWRHSIPEVIRLLVASQSSEDRIVGWELSQDYGEEMAWRESDIAKIIAELDDEVRIAAIRSVASTDPVWITSIIERMILAPEATARCKQACVMLLDKVPTESERIRLWLVASNDNALRQECLFSFSTVKSSAAVIETVATYLDDTTIITVAISDHSGWPIEIRTLGVPGTQQGC